MDYTEYQERKNKIIDDTNALREAANELYHRTMKDISENEQHLRDILHDDFSENRVGPQSRL
jgi:hypothetical protein